MTGCVSIPGVERCYKGGRKRQAGSLQTRVRRPKFVGQLALFVVEPKQPLGRNGWDEEERECPRRDLRVRDSENCDDGDIHWQCSENEGSDDVDCVHHRAVPA